MKERRTIDGKAKTVRELLKGVKYSIDFYQREYKWQEKHVCELIDDLCGKFSEEYKPTHTRTKVAEYPHYFLGSIIVSLKNGSGFLVDGQQRLTTLTLLLVFLRNLQKEIEGKVNVDELIFSEKFGHKSFNLNIDERNTTMEALYEGKSIDPDGQSESVQNLIMRYSNIEECFPEDLQGDALPYFTDWLLENVHLVEITAYSDDDAYTIFETMNDRGLSLSPTDMLKGYLLANIDEDKRTQVSDTWRDNIRKLMETGKETESDFFKAWLRSQYSTKIRERKKGAKPEDYDRIGTVFHRWLRDSSKDIGLSRSDDFFQFIERDFRFFCRQYLRFVEASKEPVAGLEHVLYNAQYGFTLQNMLLLAPLLPGDSESAIIHKMGLVAHYLDILLTWRIWNFRAIAYSTMQYTMFLTMRKIRGLAPDELASKLHEELKEVKENFETNKGLRVHQQNRYSIHRILARLTDYVEVGSGSKSRYLEYFSQGKSRYEVEHIWADSPERHIDEFPHPADFSEYRNRIGGLLLLPKSFNASFGKLPYEKKLPHYLSQNLLARSLNPQCYDHNPGFLKFINITGLSFKPYEVFNKSELEEHSELYRQISMLVWNPDDLLKEAEDGC